MSPSLGRLERRRAAPWLTPLLALLGCGEVEPSTDDPSAERTAIETMPSAAGAPALGGHGGAAAAPGSSGSSGAIVPSGGAGVGGGGTAAGDAGTGEAGDAGLPSGTGGTSALPEPQTYPALEADQLGTPVEVAGGFGLAESPLWDPCTERLLFSDVTASVIHALDADGELSVLMENTSNTNGIAFDVDGSLILAQMGGSPGHVARRARDGMVTQLDPAGSMLHTPDDVIVRSDGTIYFSDGDFAPIGTLLGAFRQLPVYAIDSGSSALREVGRVGGPNGIELSADQRTLYVSAYGDGEIVPFAIGADGSLTKGPALITGLSKPDSLCLDAGGNLYVGVGTGLLVVRPDGSEVTLIPLPAGLGQGTTSCGFGGADGKTLFITTWTTLYRLDAMPIPGLDFQVNAARITCPAGA